MPLIGLLLYLCNKYDVGNRANPMIQSKCSQTTVNDEFDDNSIVKKNRKLLLCYEK